MLIVYATKPLLKTKLLGLLIQVDNYRLTGGLKGDGREEPCSFIRSQAVNLNKNTKPTR